jgi:hypothetical protein
LQPGCTPFADCIGEPNTCAGFGVDECERQDGCSVVERCAGYVPTCDTYSAGSACDAQPGCRTDSEMQPIGLGDWIQVSTCVVSDPSLRSCANRDATTCEDLAGCSMYSHCGGSAKSCWEIETQAACDAQKGCFAQDPSGCTGTAEACDLQTTPETCQADSGCAWGVQEAVGIR